MSYTFFWGENEKPYGCLSQWYMSNFTIDNITYCCAEQWMMAEKARLFNDSESLDEILSEDRPGVIQAFGRSVKDFDRKTWDEKSYDIVLKGNMEKFKQNQELLTILKSTNDSIIAEASPYDKIWGIGLSSNNPDVYTMSKWTGKNLLGQILMDVRSSFKD